QSIPISGEVLFENNLFLTFFLLPCVHILLY
ncbi:MAG: hypothetical protein ACI9FB_003557, partial [Candidatus Azotimanducaceae bacterium]